MRYKLHHGDCLEVLATLEPESVDSIVTDPPYGLSFMGKRWDYDVPSEDVWRECLRVLKPGGHLLAFAGTRTQHRMAVRIEDAGFEIRDMIAWVYGSGFPKSMDVSKAIDKGSGENRERQLRFTAWMRSTGITADQINEATQSRMASHYLTDKSQPAIATADLFDKLRPYLPEVPEEIERLVCERTGLEWTAFKQRPVVGKGSGAISTRKDLRVDNGTVWGAKSSTFDLTAPATPEAKQWAGWGTALKPAMEPLTLARKPFASTVAANVLKHGTGAINVDGCRVEANGDRLGGGRISTTTDGWDRPWKHNSESIEACRARGDEAVAKAERLGRWPANFTHDGSDEVMALLGDAARFFYTAKASKDDRDEGLPDGQRSSHPTVKPTDLMRYLCRLITPPNGIILDPFMGSGSTGKAAMAEGFRFIGIEREAEYIEIARARISAEAEKPRQLSLF